MNFSSDNVGAVAPEIVDAIVRANSGAAPAYGDDPLTARVEQRAKTIFDHDDLVVYPVVTGTAANALALSCLCPPYGSVFCHRDSHIEVDECGAPEFYSGGAKLVLLDGDHGRIDAETLDQAIRNGGAGDVHHVQPGAVSITQPTEAGSAYRVEDVRAIADITHYHGLRLHMDGARFANAVARQGIHPADLTWRAGVDVLSLGATKNGAMAAELVVFFDPDLADAFSYRRKRGGHLVSKMRYVSAQLDAYLADDLWLRLARQANTMADRLAEGVAAIPGMRIAHPVDANEIFVVMHDHALNGLVDEGFTFSPWPGGTVRIVTTFNTREADVDRLIASATRYADAG